MEQKPKINPEKKIEAKKESPVILEPKIQDFIEFRKIKPEDFGLIEKLATFPKNLLIIELHNFFGFAREESASQLGNLAQHTKDAEKKELFETTLLFVKKYDWTACSNLIRVLENR